MLEHKWHLKSSQSQLVHPFIPLNHSADSEKTTKPTVCLQPVRMISTGVALLLPQSYTRAKMGTVRNTRDSRARQKMRKKFGCSEKYKKKLSWRKSTLPFRDDCIPCVANMKPGQPLKRLKKKYDDQKVQKIVYCPPPPPPLCPEPKIIPVKKKKLPKYVGSSSCRPKPHLLKRGKPLKKLKPSYDITFDTVRRCPEPPPPLCIKRADENLKVEKKSLKKIHMGECKLCVQPLVQGKELKRLKPRYDPSLLECKIPCPIPEKKCEQRDVGKVFPVKKLRKVIMGRCPKPKPRPQTGKPLKRLRRAYDDEKIEIICPKPEAPCAPFIPSDTYLKVKKKKLQKIIMGTCKPCINLNLKEGQALKRPKADYDPTKIPHFFPCLPTPPPCPPKADVEMQICEIKLPRLKKIIFGRIKPTPPRPCTTCGLKRLGPLPQIDKKKIYNPCPEPIPCVRADDNKSFKAKPLKKVRMGKLKLDLRICPDGPELKRLKPHYDPDIERVCEVIEETCDIDPPRMDDVMCWVPTVKILPKLPRKNTD